MLVSSHYILQQASLQGMNGHPTRRVLDSQPRDEWIANEGMIGYETGTIGLVSKE